MADKILNLYLISPFIFAILLFANIFIKKSSTINYISKIFSIFNLGFAVYFLFISHYENTSYIFLLLFALMFFFFIFLSKNYILKLNKLFFSTLIALCGLINLFILGDNVFLNFAIIFWFFLIYFLLSFSFCEKKDEKKSLKIQLINDLIVFFASTFLISFDFIRYFIINNIALNFSNIQTHISFVSDISIITSFLGFLIIAFRLLGFPLFSFKAISNLRYINNFIASFIYLTSVFLGVVLLYKVTGSYGEEILIFNNILIVYFVLNFIYLAVLSLGQNGLIKFLAYSLSAVVNIELTALFSDLKEFNICVYYFIGLILSYLCAFLVSIFLENIMKTKDINKFKKIKHDNKIIKSLILYSFCNIMNIPFLGLFTPFVLCVYKISSLDFSKSYIEYLIYFLILGIILIVFGLLNILNKVLVEPEDFMEDKIELNFSQKYAFIFLIALIILIGFNGGYILDLI